MYGYYFLFIILNGIICGELSRNIALNKNRDSGKWFWAGFFFGIYGLIAIAGMPMASKEMIEAEKVKQEIWEAKQESMLADIKKAREKSEAEKEIRKNGKI